MKGNMINYSMKDMQKLSFKGAIQLSILNSDCFVYYYKTTNKTTDRNLMVITGCLTADFILESTL